MAIKKNAAKADIGPKKKVKATFAECTAEDPLKCRYHGPKMLQDALDNLMGKGAAQVKKTKNGYEITSDDAYDAYNKVAAMLPNAKGSLGFKKAVFILGDGGFVSPESEAKLEDADILFSEDAPEKNQGETDDVDDLEGSHTGEPDLSEFADIIDAGVGEGIEPERQVDEFAEFFEAGIDDGIVPEDEKDAEDEPIKELSEEDIKNLVSFKGVTDDHFEENPDLLDNYKSIITNGTNPNGAALNESQKVWWNELLGKTKNANEDELPALKVLKATMKKVIGYQEQSPESKTVSERENVAAFSPIDEQDNNSDIDTHQQSWNNIMDTAINGKNLMGTQYWVDTIKPIVDSWNDAIAGNDSSAAAHSVMELQSAIQNAPKEKPTKESLIGEMGSVISKMQEEGLDLTWDSKKGNALGKAFEDAINSDDIEGASKALDNFKEYVEFLESGGDAPEDDQESISTEDIKDFFKKCGIKKESLLSEENLSATKEALETGKWNGKALTKGNKKWYEALAKKAPNHKVANAINEMLSEDKPPTKAGKKGVAKGALVSALSGSNESMVVEGLLKPLEHDDAKFPQNVTQEELEKAIAHPVKEVGENTLGSRLIEIGGKQYVCKAATGTSASVIRNGYNADMAYRAGGVYAPDAQLYEFGDGKTYKLSEFIPGKRLIDVWQTADEAKREEIRKDLLKGYPLDVLFSNNDVLGTSSKDSITVTITGADGKPQKTHVAFNNILIGDDGHAYRVDNDGSFAMTSTGGIKGSSGGGFITKVESEKWVNWADRQWIDDFRTLRRNEKNQGIFDRYSTADIFLSAGNINLDSVVGTLPTGIQKALAKPLFEMKQMTMRALSANLSGIKNDLMLSTALDATYEASKKGFRELCIGEISFSSGGIGAKKSDKGDIAPYPVKKPDPPKDPSKKYAYGAMLSNADYKGTKVSEIILEAAKTINYHAGFVMTDAQGKKLGGGNAMHKPDFLPTSSTIAEFKKIDREKLVELAKTSDSAKEVITYYDSVATSIDNGNKLPVQEVKKTSINELLPSGFKTNAEVEYETNKEKLMSQYHVDLKKYHDVTLPEYFKNKEEWEDKEKKKLLDGGNGLDGNFYDIANEFMEAAYNTDGIAQHNGESIDFIELGKYQNKYGGGVYGATTSNDSWTPASSHLKVLDLLMSGRSLVDISSISNNDPLVNNGHHSGKKAKDWFIGEAKKMLSNPEKTRREMIAYAVFKGLQVVKLENETANVSLSTGGNVPWIDHGSHTVALIRKESFSNASENTRAPVVQKGGNVSCGFQNNGSIGIYPYAYDVPLWNVSYTYSDENHKGSKVEAYKGSEHEWVANLIGLTPFRVKRSTDASKNVYLSRKEASIKKDREKRISRLAPFFTSMADLKNIVKNIIKGH